MSSIPHYLRLKPESLAPDSEKKECLIESQNDNQIKFKETAAFNKFTKIFNDVSQQELYNDTLQDLTKELLDHDKDSVFFTLGPSNSGKSYSIYGDDSNPGVSIYALNEIFTRIADRFADHRILKRYFGDSFLVSSNAGKSQTNGEYGLSISVFEIYNDRIRDLTLDSSKTSNQSLDIITDSKDGKTKPNKIRHIYVANLKEAKLVLHKSIKRRAVSPTGLNEKSSRSHLFIYFNLHKVVGKSFVKTSRLTIADLAGSERTKTAKTEGKEFKEGNYTNQSLTELGRCLSMMKSKKFDRSILRTSKLTRLLLTDLYGNFTQNTIKILLTLDPYSNLSTILHALRYIQPVAKVSINSERNSLETGDNIQFSRLTEEVKLLRTMNEALELEKSMSEQKLLDLEVTLRSELNEEYEEKIKELDITHQKALNELKEANQNSADEKLELLSNDYDEKLSKLKEEHDSKIDSLKENHKQEIVELEEKYQLKINELERDQQAKIDELFSANQAKIDELVSINQAKISELDNSNKTEIDKLVESYESKINELVTAHKTEIERIIVDNQSKIDELVNSNKTKINRLSEQSTSEIVSFESEISQLKAQLKDLEKSKAKSEQSLISDITKEQREKDDLRSKVQELELKLKESEDAKLLMSSNVATLTSELERMKNKRKSDTFDDESATPNSKKGKFEQQEAEEVKEEQEEELNEKENEEVSEKPSFEETESQLTSMSPIKVNRPSSPSKISKFASRSPSRHRAVFQSPFKPSLKIRSPSKPKSDAPIYSIISTSEHKAPSKPEYVSPSKNEGQSELLSPIRRKSPKKVSFESPPKVLQEINFDMPLPSPKIKIKSPSKKKKLTHRSIVNDDSF